MNPELSIIVPAYKEQKNIQNTIEQLQKYFENWIYKTEIIVIVDGCEDTWEVAKNLGNEFTKIYFYTPNQGKGYALKFGVTKAQGNYTIFFDAGMDFPIDNILLIFYTLKVTGFPVVIGSKRNRASKLKYPWQRRILSLSGQLLTKVLFNLGVSDTQVGIKGFRTDKIQFIMQKMLVKRFAFDIELLAIAKQYKYKITEVPVRMMYNGITSSIDPKAVINVLVDVMAVFYRIKIGYYRRDTTQNYQEELLSHLTKIQYSEIQIFNKNIGDKKSVLNKKNVKNKYKSKKKRK